MEGVLNPASSKSVIEMMRVMSDDVESLCLVKECRELEEGFGTSFTDELLSGAESGDFRDVGK